MRLTISRSSLVGYLTKIKPHLGKAGILSNIKATINSTTLELMAQDGYTSLEAEISISDVEGHGSFLFPISILDYAKTLSDLQISLEVELPENADETGKLSMPGADFVILSSFDYPPVIERNWVELATLDGMGLNLALTTAPNFASKTDVTAAVKVCVGKREVLTYATDKSYAYQNKGPAPHSVVKPVDILIGGAYLTKLQDVVSESAKFYTADNLYKVRSGSFTMTFGAGDVSKYPPTINSLFADPAAKDQAILVDRMAFKQAIRTALIFVKSRAQNPVSLTINEDGSKLLLSAVGTNGSHNNEIPIVGFVGKPDTEAAFCFSAYRLEKILSHLDSDVVAIGYGTYTPAQSYVVITESPLESAANEVLLSVVVINDNVEMIEDQSVPYSEINDVDFESEGDDADDWDDDLEVED